MPVQYYIAHNSDITNILFSQMLGIYSAFPSQLEQDLTFVESLLKLEDSLPWQPLTPGCHGRRACNAQSVVARGIPPTKLKGYESFENTNFISIFFSNNKIKKVCVYQMTMDNYTRCIISARMLIHVNYL